MPSQPPGANPFASPNSVIRFLAILIAVLFVFLTLVSLTHMGADFARPTAPTFLFGLVAAAGALWMTRLLAAARRPSQTWSLVCLSAAFIASRIAVILYIPAVQVSDFASYVRLSQLMEEHAPLPVAVTDPLFFPWGFSFLLAVLTPQGSNSLHVIWVVNVACGLVSLWLLYFLIARCGGPAPARAAAILFLLWPAQLFLTPVAASEHAALPMILAALLLVAIVSAKPNSTARPPYALLIAIGFFLGLAALVRPALIVVGFVCATYFVLTVPRWRALVWSALLLCVMLAMQFGFSERMQQRYGRRPPTVMWWNLLAGLNLEARGRWNEPDATQFFSYPTLEESNGWAREEIGRRLLRNPLKQAQLAIHKLKLLWGDNYYGLWWATRELAPGPAAERLKPHLRSLFVASQLYHIPLLALTAAGAWQIARRPDQATRVQTLALLLLVLGTLQHLVFETQTRYAHVFTLGAILLAASTLSNTKQNAARHGGA